MKDFVKWCMEKDLVEVAQDGTIAWKEGTCCHKEKIEGPRDARKDLSGDYKGHFHKMDTVWPFKLVGKSKSGKAVASVAK